MNILHIIPSLRKGGAERLVLDICIALSRVPGCNVTLVTFSDENEYSHLSRQVYHRVIPSKVIPSISGRPVVQVDALLRFIYEIKPDVIHSHLFEAEMVSRWVTLSGVKYITHCHDNMHQFRKFGWKDLLSKKRLTELYERHLIIRMYKIIDNRFIAISNHTSDYFKKSLPASLAKNITLLPNAINCKKFSHYGRDNDIKLLSLINIGSFVPKKNQKFLLLIAEQLKKRGVDFRVVMLGDGPLRSDIERMVRESGLQSQVSCTGNVDNVEEYLHRYTIYVHTSVSEPFGLVLLEAMASGLPVVTLNGGGNADLIDNGKNGFLINKQDAELFADKIMEIWENKNLYSQMSTYAQEFAKQYDIKEYVDKLLELYKN